MNDFLICNVCGGILLSVILLSLPALLSLQHVINLLCLDKIFTQISFSGYGDVSCQTVLGKMFLVLFLLVGLVGAQIHFIPWLLLKS